MEDLCRNRLAVMFTDIAGFTSLMESNETKAMIDLTLCREILDRHLEQYSGSLVKVMGDGSLSTFSDPSGALECAVSFQKSISKSDFRVRVGIHWGDVIQENNDIFGDTVNIASRLEGLSLPGYICISREILSECTAEDLPAVQSLGLHRLKGLGRLIEVYVIKGAGSLPDIRSDGADEIQKPSDQDGVPSIAVIPFDNLGSDKDSFYAYGISADLASDLSRAGSIHISSLSDVARIPVSDLSPAELAARLGVRYLVNGSLWREKDKFRISVELTDQLKNRTIWVDSWEDDWFCLSSIKGKLADGLLKAIGIEPGIFPGITGIITEQTDAYELYLKGRHTYSRRLSKNDLFRARKYLKRSIELDPGLIQTRVLYGATYRDQGEYTKGNGILRNALEIAIQNGDPVGQLKALNGIGISLWRQSLLEEAKRTMLNALSMSERISDRGGQARAYNNLGLIEWSSGNFRKALSCFEDSLVIAEELAAATMQSNTLCNIGLVNASLGDDETALEFHRKALEIQLVLGNLAMQAHILINMGNSYFRSGSIEKALSIFQRSLSICKELGDRPGESKSLNNLGNIMVYLGMFDSAERYYSEALEIAKKHSDLSMEGIVLSGMGLLHLRSGDDYKSLSPLLDSLEICRTTLDREGEAEVLGQLGEVYLNQNRSAEADEVLREALKIMKEIGLTSYRAYVEALLSRNILKMNMSRIGVSEAVRLIDSALQHVKYQNVKDRSHIHGILSDSYLALELCNYPDLINSAQCREAHERMIDSSRKLLLEIADSLDDSTLRKAFLEEIPAHREIIRKADRRDILTESGSADQSLPSEMEE